MVRYINFNYIILAGESMVQYSISVSDEELGRVEKLNTLRFKAFKRAQIMRACMLKGLEYFEKGKL
jgi:hypothetical protein